MPICTEVLVSQIVMRMHDVSTSAYTLPSQACRNNYNGLQYNIRYQSCHIATNSRLCSNSRPCSNGSPDLEWGKTNSKLGRLGLLSEHCFTVIVSFPVYADAFLVFVGRPLACLCDGMEMPIPIVSSCNWKCAVL